MTTTQRTLASLTSIGAGIGVIMATDLASLLICAAVAIIASGAVVASLSARAR